jgi:hypothetical protein
MLQIEGRYWWTYQGINVYKILQALFFHQFLEVVFSPPPLVSKRQNWTSPFVGGYVGIDVKH